MNSSAWGQCRCDLGDCDARTPVGFSEASFTIPLGDIASFVCAAFGCEIPAAGVLIPDIKITLNRALEGETSVACPDGCCGSGALSVDIYAYLQGQAELDSWPPSSVEVTGFKRVKKVKDNDLQDQVSRICRVGTNFSISIGGISVDLVLPGGITVPVTGRGTGDIKAYWQVGCGCGHGTTHPPINQMPALSVPTQVIIPIAEGRAEFQARAEDPEHDRLWFEAGLQGVAGIVTIDQTGHGEITIPPGVEMSERAKAVVTVYDLKPGATGPPASRDQYYHEVFALIPLVFTTNRPPQACDIDATIYLGSPYPEQFHCVVQDPDGDSLWGLSWQRALPQFCFDASMIERERLYMVVQCDPRFAKEGNYEANYVVWDTGTPPLWARGRVAIHVLRNEPPSVSRGG
jgi:hypothetical protein